MRVFYDKPADRVELIPENAADQHSIDEQFGPWEKTADPSGLRGPIGDNFEVMVCRREKDGAVLLEIALGPDHEET